MKYYFNKLQKTIVLLLSLFLLVAFDSSAVVYAQKTPEPTRREQLLNGLKLLVWADPKSSDVMIKLRIHSGAAFDPKDKEGVMTLLAESMFPDEQTKLFFEEELGGNLKAESNQDFIEITARGRSENFERMLDTVRLGVTNPPLTPENFKKIQAAQIKVIETESFNLSKTADAAVRKKIFGDFFPYGRPIEGTINSLAKIDRVDLIQARDRFLTADNATLIITGNIDSKLVVRFVKQYFGAWNKADKLIPATFRQPESPEKGVTVIKKPKIKTAEIRFALRGVAQNSSDFAAAEIAALIMQERWQKNLPSELRLSSFARHEAHALPGILIFGAQFGSKFSNANLDAVQTAFNKTLNDTVLSEEFNLAKTRVLSNINQTDSVAEIADNWLDIDTFKLKVGYNLGGAIASVSPSELSRVIANWQKQTPSVVVVTPGEENSITSK